MSTAAVRGDASRDERGVYYIRGITVVLVCAAAALSALLELFYIPVYVGAAIAPFTVLAAAVGNVLLPRLGRAAWGSTAGGVLAVVFWLVPLLVLSLLPRPEGDVIVEGGQNQQYVFYALVLVGSLVGFASALVSAVGRSAASGSVR
jgi:hypothetical protein